MTVSHGLPLSPGKGEGSDNLPEIPGQPERALPGELPGALMDRQDEAGKVAPGGLPLQCRAFRVPKAGNSLDDYEDAYDFDAQAGRFAIADGASEASFAKQWAILLVEGFTPQPLFHQGEAYDSLAAWLKPLQEAWHQGINWDNLPYFAEEKARAGAFATLLGVQFDFHHGSRHWHAVAVGDSCLFQVRGDCVLESFPLTRAAEFNYSPALLASVAARNKRLWEEQRVRFQEIKDEKAQPPPRWRKGDRFYLATDALAHWFLSRYEDNGEPWKILDDLKDQAQFEEFVHQQRHAKSLHNDDTTLLIIQVVP
jgi:hypothetical protein